MSYEMTGRIIKKGDIQEIGAKKFKKLEIVLETDGKYPQQIKLEITGDKAEEFKQTLTAGQQITARFDVRGREWEGRYFVNLNMYGYSISDSSLPTETPDNAPDNDDLPF